MALFKDDEEFVEEWEETRKMGMPKFMLTHGTFFGILMIIVMTAFELFDHSSEFELISFGFLKLVLLNLFMGILGYGSIMWVLKERVFKNIKERRKS